MFKCIIFVCSLWLWFFVTVVKAFGQGETCNNPILVTTCPVVTYTSVSTAGMGNDMNITQYGYLMRGNDIVYKITPPVGSTRVLVSISNLSANAVFFASNTPCAVPYYPTTYLYAGNTYDNLSYYATNTSPLYLSLDHNNTYDITFNISFGSLGNPQTIIVPDTRGSWDQAAGCITPITKPTMNVKWNGVRQALPMTLSPLNTQGTMCITSYQKNLSGQEGIKSISFTFDPDLVNPQSTVTQMNGFYNAGTWNATKNGSVITWTFTDAAGLGRGDFTGTPNNCLAYDFCFTFTPVSNIPDRTNVNLLLTSDNYGRGYTQTINQGCCPTPTNCPLTGGTSTGGGRTIAIGINDPPLPVELISFTAAQSNDDVLLEWMTAMEVNNDHFEIERSLDGVNFGSIGAVAAAGRAANYSFTDGEQLSGDRNYRLKQVDRNGATTYSNVVTVQNNSGNQVQVFPVPAQQSVSISSALPISEYAIVDMYGNSVANETIDQLNTYEISLQNIPVGVYYIRVKIGDAVIVKRLVKQ